MTHFFTWNDPSSIRKLHDSWDGSDAQPTKETHLLSFVLSSGIFFKPALCSRATKQIDSLIVFETDNAIEPK